MRKKVSREKFDWVYNRLKGYYGVTRIHPEEDRPIKVFHEGGVAYALRWKPNCGPHPTPEQFAKAHGIEVYD
jgi:hypothetical protein